MTGPHKIHTLLISGMCSKLIISHLYSTHFYSPRRFTTYLPRKPVAPNTVTVNPLTDDRPPAPRFIGTVE